MKVVFVVAKCNEEQLRGFHAFVPHTWLRHTWLRHTWLRHTWLRHTWLRHTWLRHTWLIRTSITWFIHFCASQVTTKSLDPRHVTWRFVVLFRTSCFVVLESKMKWVSFLSKATQGLEVSIETRHIQLATSQTSTFLCLYWMMNAEVSQLALFLVSSSDGLNPLDL